MSFWKDNPFAPSWKSVLNQTEPSLCCKGSSQLRTHPSTYRGVPIFGTQRVAVQDQNSHTCESLASKAGQDIGVHNFGTERYQTKQVFKIQQEKEIEDCLILWKRWYKTSNRCRISIDPTFLKNRVSSGEWICYVARDLQFGECIGSVISRPLGWLRIGPTVFKNVRCIDFLCVAEGWRKRGVARELLIRIHNHMAEANATTGIIPPHLFLLETPQIQIPPLCTVSLVRRLGGLKGHAVNECKEISQIQEALYRLWIDRKIRVVSVPSVESGGGVSGNRLGATRIVRIGGWYLAIQDTWHRTIPEGFHIIELLGPWRAGVESAAEISAEEAVELCVDSTVCKKSIVLTSAFTPRSSADWVPDATGIQWIAYNIQSGIPIFNAPLLLH